MTKNFRVGTFLFPLALAIPLGFTACKKEEPKAEVPLQGSAPRMRRMLDRQYRNTIGDLLGPAAASQASPPADVVSRGSESIGAGEVALSPSAVYQYELSARLIAAAAIASPSALNPYLTCTPAGFGDADCYREFVYNFGRRAFRRVLTSEELDRYGAIALNAGTALTDFDRGLEHAISAILQSSSFLFQVEIGMTDPLNPFRRKLSSTEMASRLSYFLLDTTPDDALLTTGETGGLDDAAEVRTMAASLLERPEAKTALREFYRERFKLKGLASMQKDPAIFPLYSPALVAAMETESLMLLDEVVWELDGDFHDLYDAPYAWVNADLAELYGVNPPTSGFAKRQLPAEQGRAGIFTQASTLSILANATTTSPTRRGKFVQERFFCRDIMPPPPGVDTNLPPDPGVPETMRQKLERHQTDPTCAGCHVYMDNVGFGLEHFDGLGQWRETDQGLTIDDDGEVMEVGTFDGATGLAALVRATPASDRCFVRGLYRHATGHFENGDEEIALTALDESYALSGFRIKALLVDLAASDEFRYTGRKAVFVGGSK